MEEKNKDSISVIDALREGISPEDIRKSFEAALQEAQDEIAAEQEKKYASCSGNCAECLNCTDVEVLALDDAREDLVIAVLEYLLALGMLPEDTEFSEEDIDEIIESIKKIEEEYKLEIGLIKMLSGMKTKDDKTKANDDNKPSADDVIKEFLKSLS